MYVRKVVFTHAGKRYVKYVLVESVRTPQGPRQKVICSLGDLHPRPAAEWLRLARRVEVALSEQLSLGETKDPEVDKIVRKIRSQRQQGCPQTGEADDPEEPESVERVSVDPRRVRTERHREVGSVHVGYPMWQRLGLDTILANIGLDERTRELSCAMVLNRLIHPCSEHAMPPS